MVEGPTREATERLATELAHEVKSAIDKATIESPAAGPEGVVS